VRLLITNRNLNRQKSKIFDRAQKSTISDISQKFKSVSIVGDVIVLCEKCEYEWENRIENPKSCPRCKYRFDYKEIKNGVDKTIQNVD